MEPVDISKFKKNQDGEFITTFQQFKELRESPHLDFIDSNTGKKPVAVLRLSAAPSTVVFDMDGKHADDSNYSMLWRG